MCIIISKPKGTIIPQEHLKHSHINNQDGVGIMYAQEGVVKIEKWLNQDYDTFVSRLAELENKNVVVHYRAASVGGVNLNNVHPFWVFENKMAMCHNGTIFKARELAKEGESDSCAFARMLSEMPVDFLGRQGLVLMMKEYIGTQSRLAFLDENGTIAIINKHLGKEVNGVWYSNDYFERVYPKRGCSVEFPTTSAVFSKSAKLNDKLDGYGGVFDFDRKSPSGNLPLRYKAIDTARINKKSNRVNVFVYGTLKRGYGNNHCLGEEATYIGTAVTTVKYPMLDGIYPYLLDKPNEGHIIKGEMWQIPVKQLLSEVDRLEGYPTHYVRRVIEVATTGGAHKAVAYFKASVSDHDMKQTFIHEWIGRGNVFNTAPEDAYLNDTLDDDYEKDEFDDTDYHCVSCGYCAKGSTFIEQGCCPECMSCEIEID